jgi:hypothetical protein
MPRNPGTEPQLDLSLVVDSLTGSDSTGSLAGNAHPYQREFIAAGSANEDTAYREAVISSGISSAEAVSPPEIAPIESSQIRIYSLAGVMSLELVAGYLLVSNMIAPQERDERRLPVSPCATAALP